MSVEWIAVDWGTSNLRIWGMGADDAVLQTASSDEGMGGLERDQFETVLLKHIDPWLSKPVTPIMACGMVGSRQGWAEAPYDTAPTKPALKTVKVRTDARIDLRIVSGIKQDLPADVMRGEETQIAGYLAGCPEFSGVICLPGTHSKWVRINDGQVVEFQTVLTGELFSVVSQGTVLKHSMGDWNADVFQSSFENAMQNPSAILSGLFRLRAEHLINDDPNGVAKLSANLLAAEFAGVRAFWENEKIVFIGSSKLCGHYEEAAKLLSLEYDTPASERLTLKGLSRVYNEVFAK